MRKHQNVELVSRGQRFRRLANKPNFRSFKIFSDELVAVNMAKTEVLLSKPMYIGAAVLDISKTLMFKFHYEKMRARYGDKARLLMTDTDSLVYQVFTDDVYVDMTTHSDDFDTSGYPKDHMLYSTTNARALGKMKDEYGGKIIAEFVGESSFYRQFVSTD